MKKIEIHAARNRGESTLVQAYETDTPGLVVHRGLATDRLLRNRWVVTHRESGIRFPGGGFATRAEAVAAADRLNGIVDWTLSRDEVVNAGRSIGLYHIEKALVGPRKGI